MHLNNSNYFRNQSFCFSSHFGHISIFITGHFWLVWLILYMSRGAGVVVLIVVLFDKRHYRYLRSGI